jgi:septum formation protein
MDTLVLASTSPRRREILNTLKIPYIVFSESVEENIKKEDNRHIIPSVINLSKKKVLAAAQNFSNGLVVGVDTVVYFQRRVLGKPENEEQAWKFLRMLRGNRHSVISGITVRNIAEERNLSSCSVTDVYFQSISDSQVRKYIEQGEWAGKAGGYGIQGQAALFVDKITGSFFNVVGLPVEELFRLLSRFNYFESQGLYRPIKIM